MRHGAVPQIPTDHADQEQMSGPCSASAAQAILMTQSSTMRGPQIPALLLFRRIAPIFARELAQKLCRSGLVNSADLIDALLTGLRSFARERSVCLAVDSPKAWPEALRAQRGACSEAEWARFLRQTATAPRATPYQIACGAAQVVRVLDAGSEVVHMSPRIATALGTWIVTAVVLSHRWYQRQSTEIHIRIALMNRFSALGTADIVRAA